MGNIAVAEDEMLTGYRRAALFPLYSFLLMLMLMVVFFMFYCFVNPSVHIFWRRPNFVLQLLLMGVILS